MDNELYHHGVKGMKWGVRRYQNKDGSLTERGQRRYETEAESNSKKKKDKRIPEEGLKDPHRWVREDRERTKAVADAGVRLTGDLKKAADLEFGTKKRMDLSKMTDKEMREKINRELLERQYNDVFSPKKESKGRTYVKQVLDTTGTVLGIGSSALGIAIAIKNLSGH